jgi:hypothetical protein
LATNPLACWIQGIPRCWLQPFCCWIFTSQNWVI